MIIWTLVQLCIFVVLMIMFVMSPTNQFMRDGDCCTADQYLTRAGNDLPLRDSPTSRARSSRSDIPSRPTATPGSSRTCRRTRSTARPQRSSSTAGKCGAAI